MKPIIKIFPRLLLVMSGFNRQSAVYWLALMAVICTAGAYSYFAQKVITQDYLPSAQVGDGFGYYLGAKSLFLNKTLISPLIHLNKVSLIGEFYSHGFAYSLLNGTISLIFGWSDITIVLLNAIFILASAAILLLYIADRLLKLAILLILLTFYITPTMTFSFMQESIHIFFAVVASILLIEASKTTSSSRRHLVLAFLAVLVAAALFRPLWLLWSTALLAFGKSRRELSIYLLIVISSLALSLVFMKAFYAPYPYYSPQDDIMAEFHAGGITAALLKALYIIKQNVLKLANSNFYIFGKTHIPNFYTILISIGNVYLLYLFFTTRDRLLLAGFFVGSAYIAAIFVLYDTLAGARQIAVVFVLQMLFLAHAGQTKVISAVAVLQILLLPAVLAMTYRIVAVQIDAGAHVRQNADKLSRFEDLGQTIRLGRRATIYVNYDLSNGPHPEFVRFPLRSGDSHPLRYSLNIYAFNTPLEQRTFDRELIDYVMTGTRVDRPDLEPVYASDGLYLYRLR